ncbi:MAG: DUF5131 family protein [Desulfomonilaceae bacterium]
MSKTKIQWTEYNWNPFTGCTPVSPGCANCYARKNARRLAGNPKTDRYSKGFEFSVHPECFDQALRWKKPRKVFVNTMSDTFHENAPLEVIQQVFDYMVNCPQHIFQVLTKRAERMAELSAKLPWPDNVWAGVTVENADYVNRLDFLRQVPAKVRFVSFEPLLSAIPNINFGGIHWAIVGGESGPKARPMDLDWARGIRDQCLRSQIPFFFKQVGGKGRDKGGRLLDGQEWNSYPLASTSTVIPQKDHKAPVIKKGTIEKTVPEQPNSKPSSQAPNTCPSLSPMSPTCMKLASIYVREEDSNVIVVVPHGYPGDDENAEILGYHLSKNGRFSAVINNRKYRRPKTDRLGIPTEKPDLKKRIIDLNDPEQAQMCKQDYLTPIFTILQKLLSETEGPVYVIFLHGMGDDNADRHGAGDICVGKGFTGAYDPKKASASERFLILLIRELERRFRDLATHDVPRYSGESKMARWLREKYGERIQAVQIEIRCTGYRDTRRNLRQTAQLLWTLIDTAAVAHEMEVDKEMSKKKRSVAKGTEANKQPVDQQPASQVVNPEVSPAKEEDTTPVQTSGALGMVDRAKFEAIVDELRQRKTIKDDKGKEIDFTDALKTSLVNDVESAYTVLTAALGNIYDTGKFMYEVRKRQKKHRLWMSFQEIVGMRKSATNNYIRVYERFGDRLSKYGHLGVSKLQDVARLKDPFTFIEANKELVEKGDVRSVTKMVRAEVDAKRTKKSKREPQHVEVGSFRIKLATNGRVLTIQGLNKEMQNKLVAYLKGFVSQEK